MNDEYSNRPCRLCGGTKQQRLFPIRSEYSGMGVSQYIVERCESCHVLRVDPDPPPEDLATLYGREHQGDALCERERWKDWVKRSHWTPLLGQAERARGPGRILDVGCGNGLFLSVARERGWEVQGVDLNPANAELAWQRYRIAVQTASVHDMDWPPQSFDLVRLGHILEHLVDPLPAFVGVHRVLKPGALLNVGVPCFDPHVQRMVDRLPSQWLAMKVTSVLSWIDPPHHVLSWSSPSLQRALAASGFEVTWLRRSSSVVPLMSGFGRAWLYSTLARPLLWLMGSGMTIEVLATRRQ